MQDVAEFTTTCERYVGTESGGMDQAISMMGMPQIAKLIEFHPVSLPFTGTQASTQHQTHRHSIKCEQAVFPQMKYCEDEI